MNPFTIDSLSQYIEDEKPPNWDVKYFFEDEGQVNFTKIPKTPEIEIHWYIEKYISDIRSHSLQPFYVAKANSLKMVSFNDVGSISLMTNDNQVFKDVSTHYDFKDAAFPPAEHIDSKSVLLSIDAGSNYFHWMCHVLPRIKLLKEYGIDWNEINKILIPQTRGPFVHETLDALNVPKHKLLETTKNKHYTFDSLIIPCKPNRHIHLSRWSLEFLRSTFINKGHSNIDKIYVSRKSDAGRGIKNQNEIWSTLQPLGFQEIFLEDFSVEDQARLFNNAKVIVSPHGAGLTNLAFCEPGTKVVELFSPNYVLPLYWNFCNILDLDYYYLIGEGERPPRGIDPHLKNETISVNIEELYRTMQ